MDHVEIKPDAQSNIQLLK